jgi:hypothetical protein
MQGYCCPGGNICLRQSEWYYQCTPAIQSTQTLEAYIASEAAADAAATAAATHGAGEAITIGTGAVAVASASVGSIHDLLLIQAPDTATATRVLSVSATLLRQGKPVSATEVKFTVSGTGAGRRPYSFTKVGRTRSNGKATVTFAPVSWARVKGSTSQVLAYTVSARAQGAKGTIPATSVPVGVTWT